MTYLPFFQINNYSTILTWPMTLPYSSRMYVVTKIFYILHSKLFPKFYIFSKNCNNGCSLRLHYTSTSRDVTSCWARNLHLFWPYHVFPYFQPIRTLVILSNGEAPYSDQSRASNTVSITWRNPLIVTSPATVTVYTSRCALLQHFAA